MARPKLTIRPKEKTLSIPETLTKVVDELLYSELEQKVPHGAWSQYVSQLILSDLIRRKRLRDQMNSEVEGLMQ